MSKKGKITLICVAAALALILCIVGVLAIVANSQNDRSVPMKELSQWMGMIKDDTLLKNIVIPGAHDAGTKGLSYLAETQDRDTADLLACGTRYFDLRVTKTKGGELKIFHGPFSGVTLNSVLTEFVSFLQQNPTEMLILDFQHFGGDAQLDTQKAVLSTLPYVTAVGDFVEFVDGLTLGQTRGKCLILWGDDTADGKTFLRRNNDECSLEHTALQSYYEGALNKKSSSKYVEEALPYYIGRYVDGGEGLFVLQGQLTDGMFVFGPRFREATHTKNMNAYVDSLYHSTDLKHINIIMRDFVTPYKNCLALQLNVPKKNVKAKCLDTFETMLAETLQFVRAAELY